MTERWLILRNHKRERNRDHDARRRDDKPYRAWYSTKRWRQRRARQLSEYPLCVMCLEANRTVEATVADHKERHGGDPDKFWHGELQSLCTTHHNSTKQAEERGTVRGMDASGAPTDPGHHWNR